MKNMAEETPSPTISESELDLSSIDSASDGHNNKEDPNHLAAPSTAATSRPTLERQPSTGWENLRDTLKSPAFDEQKRKKAWRESLQKCVDDMRALLFSSTASTNLDLSNEEIDLFAKIFDVQFATNLEEYSESFFDTLKYQEIAQVARDIQGHLADVVSRIPNIPTPQSSPSDETAPLTEPTQQQQQPRGLKAVSKSAAFVNFTSEQLVDRKKERKLKLSNVIKRLQKFEELPPDVAESFGITPMRQQLFGNLREFQDIVSQACDQQEQERMAIEKEEKAAAAEELKKREKKRKERNQVTFGTKNPSSSPESSDEDEDDRATYFTDVFGDYLRKNRRNSSSYQQLIGGIAEEEDVEDGGGEKSRKEEGQEENPLSAIMNLTKKLQERAEKRPDDEAEIEAEEEERKKREEEETALREEEDKARACQEAKFRFQAKVEGFVAALLEIEAKIRHLGEEMVRFRDLLGLHSTILESEPEVEPTMLERKLFSGLRDHIEICDELKEVMESANNSYQTLFQHKFRERRDSIKAKRRSWAAVKIQSNWKRYSARKRFQQLVTDVRNGKNLSSSSTRHPIVSHEKRRRESVTSTADSGIGMSSPSAGSSTAMTPPSLMRSSVPPLRRKASNSSLSSWSSKASSSSSESGNGRTNGSHHHQQGGRSSNKGSKAVREPSSPPTLVRRLKMTEQWQQQPLLVSSSSSSAMMSSSSSPGSSRQHSPSMNKAILTKRVLNNVKSGGNASTRSSSPAAGAGSRGSSVAGSELSSRNSSIDAGRSTAVMTKKASPSSSFARLPKI